MENQIADELKLKIQELLGEEIVEFRLEGKGYCNNAYFAQTLSGKKYIIKQKRDDSGAGTQENDLLVEASILKLLSGLDISIATPQVFFVSEDPKMLGYEYIVGEKLIDVWESLSEDEKISVCSTLGFFHSEIGKKVTKEMVQGISVSINPSTDLHPEVLADYERLIVDPEVPDEFKNLAQKSKELFDTTHDKVIFQFLHNDSHHENILIRNRKISGIIDFGSAEYGEVAKEFSRYIRDFPEYFQYIVSAYEKESGHILSCKRLVSNAMLSDFVDVVASYKKGGTERIKAEKSMMVYRKLVNRVAL